MSKVPDNQLRAPVTPKLADVDAERTRLEFVAKIVELQNMLRKHIEGS
jgi:hypothetical protein